MVDTLDTAGAFGLWRRPQGPQAPEREARVPSAPGLSPEPPSIRRIGGINWSDYATQGPYDELVLASGWVATGPAPRRSAPAWPRSGTLP